MMDTVFFYLSKILWSLIAPDSLLLYLLVAGVVCLWRQRLGAARRLLGIALACLLVIGFFPVGHWLLYPLEKRFAVNPELPAQVDGIIVLGGAFQPLESYSWNQVEMNNAAERNVALVELARRYPQARLLMSGGSGTLDNRQFREADVARELFVTLGVDVSRMEFERDSRNTVENARNSKALLAPQPGENWVLITSAAHMPRAVGVFCEQGWPVLPWPVDHETAAATLFRFQLNLASNLVTLTRAVHEWTGTVAYYIGGNTSALLPSTCLIQE